MKAPTSEYLAYLCLGLIVGAIAYIVVGALWLANFAWQNAVAG